MKVPPGFGLRQSSGALTCARERGEKKTKPWSHAPRWKSGDGLPRSKRCGDNQGRVERSARTRRSSDLGALTASTEWSAGENSSSVGRARWESGRGLPQSKTLRDNRGRGESSARFWTAPVLWRFDVRTREG